MGDRAIPPEVAARTFDIAGTPLRSTMPLDDLEALASVWGVSIAAVDRAIAEFEGSVHLDADRVRLALLALSPK